MVTVISHKEIKSVRKEYHCDACEYMLNFGSFNEFCQGSGLTFAEKRALVRAKENKYKILIGQPYIRQFNTQDGFTFDFKAIPEIHAICVKYDVYQE